MSFQIYQVTQIDPEARQLTVDGVIHDFKTGRFSWKYLAAADDGGLEVKTLNLFQLILRCLHIAYAETRRERVWRAAVGLGTEPPKKGQFWQKLSKVIAQSRPVWVKKEEDEKRDDILKGEIPLGDWKVQLSGTALSDIEFIEAALESPVDVEKMVEKINQGLIDLDFRFYLNPPGKMMGDVISSSRLFARDYEPNLIDALMKIDDNKRDGVMCQCAILALKAGNPQTAEAFAARINKSNVNKAALKSLYETALLKGNLAITAEIEKGMSAEDQAEVLFKALPKSKQERASLRNKISESLDQNVIGPDDFLEIFEQMFNFSANDFSQQDEAEEIFDLALKLKDQGLVLSPENFTRIRWMNEASDVTQIVRFLKTSLGLSNTHISEIIVLSCGGETLANAVEGLKVLELNENELNKNEAELLKHLCSNDFLVLADQDDVSSLVEYLKAIPNLNWSQVFLDKDCWMIIPFIVQADIPLDDPAAKDPKGEGIFEKIKGIRDEDDRKAYAEYCEKHHVPGVKPIDPSA
jgi:hypothetical protein